MSELSDLTETIGQAATVKLIEAFAGTRVDVPKIKPKKHELIELLGPSDFAQLHRYFGGTRIVVPVARRWRIEIYKQQGKTRREMALLLHVSETQVYNLLGGKRRAAGQLTLALD